MPITFADSPRSTLGLEWELALVDRESHELVNDAPHLLEELGRRWPKRDLAPQATSELLENTVEIISAPHEKVSGAIGDLRELSTSVLALAEGRGLEVIGAGTHPFSQWEHQSITAGERYDRFIERTRWWGRNMLIWGLHVHVGVDRKERVVPIMHALLAYYPHLHALSASSPFWRGERTGYASNRTLMFQQLSTAGLPPDLDDWVEYEQIIGDLTTTGIIQEPTEARWDIRPAPRWGTVEMRACDGTATLWEAAAIAALTQCLVEYFQTLLDRGDPLPRLQAWFVRENKWRAARYGLDAEVIVDAGGRQTGLRAEIAALVETLEPIADRLGCAAEFAGVGRILDAGNSAERQLAVYESARADGDRTAVERVAELLTREFRQSVR